MTEHDTAYFRMRARRERLMAASCQDAALADIHLDLANRYDARVAAAQSCHVPKADNGRPVIRI
ncbi:MAG: hypothetical protein ACRCSO_12945 [Sphingomonas sp.]